MADGDTLLNDTQGTISRYYASSSYNKQRNMSIELCKYLIIFVSVELV
jgi:hypothetical protein